METALPTEAFRILVAVDFSETSDRAMTEAIRLAGRLGAEIDIVHVSLSSPAELILPSPLDLGPAEAAKRKLLELEQIVVSCGLTARTHLRLGSVVYSLLDAINQLKPTLVVVGSHGRGVFAQRILGSVADALLRRSAVPVLVVPSPRRSRAADESAWSCADCGHIFSSGESPNHCAHCGTKPARWLAAPLSAEPADALEASIADSEGEHIAEERGNDPMALFATSPPGTEGCSINPELRVRY